MYSKKLSKQPSVPSISSTHISRQASEPLVRKNVYDSSMFAEQEAATFISKATNTTVFYQSWKPKFQYDRHGIVYMFHGLHDHSARFEGMALELIAKNFEVRTMDFVGHGQSDGLKGYFERFPILVADAYQFITQTMEAEHKSGDKPPVFLLGQGIGGSVSFHLALQLPFKVCGVVFTSPCFRIHSKFHAVLQKVASLGSKVTPKLAIASVSFHEYCHNSKIVEAIKSDPLICTQPIRMRVGHELLKETSRISKLFADFTYPFLAIHGSGDKICDIAGTEEMYNKSTSADKQFKKYEGGLHDLTHDYGFELTVREIVDWMCQRRTRNSTVASSQIAINSAKTTTDTSVGSASSVINGRLTHPSFMCSKAQSSVSCPENYQAEDLMANININSGSSSSSNNNIILSSSNSSNIVLSSTGNVIITGDKNGAEVDSPARDSPMRATRMRVRKLETPIHSLKTMTFEGAECVDDTYSESSENSEIALGSLTNGQSYNNYNYNYEYNSYKSVINNGVYGDGSGGEEEEEQEQNDEEKIGSKNEEDPNSLEALQM